MPTPTELARTAYEAYGATIDHTNYRGLPMPIWDDLGDRTQAAWVAAANAVAGTDLVQACAEAEEYKQDAQRTCVLVADMHKAAVGEVRAPTRGVVEDVEDVRKELIILRELVSDFASPEPCSLDHHGGCQEHWWPDTDCPHARARALGLVEGD